MVLDLKKYRHTDPRGERSRKLPKVNISRLARDVDINRGHLTRIINGEIRPGRDVLFKLAKRLDGSVEEVDRWLARLQDERRKKAS